MVDKSEQMIDMNLIIISDKYDFPRLTYYDILIIMC